MTADQVPDTAVQIAENVLNQGSVYHGHAHAQRVVAALARAGWLHDPAEVERLRLIESRARNYLYPGVPSSARGTATVILGYDALDAAPAATAETTSGEAGCECDHVGPGLCFVHGFAGQGTDDPPSGVGLPGFCP